MKLRAEFRCRLKYKIIILYFNTYRCNQLPLFFTKKLALFSNMQKHANPNPFQFSQKLDILNELAAKSAYQTQIFHTSHKDTTDYWMINCF
jgi:hypothetical protein